MEEPELDKNGNYLYRVVFKDLSIPLKILVIISWVMIILFALFIGMIYYTGG